MLAEKEGKIEGGRHEKGREVKVVLCFGCLSFCFALFCALFVGGYLVEGTSFF